MTSEQYVCTLSNESVIKAEKELNEKPEERLGMVDTFRQWIVSQPHIKCSTDTKFLLRFMRRCHFSQLEARSVLEKFLTNKTNEPEWLSDLDTMDKKVQSLLKTGYYVPLPGYSDQGRKILIHRDALLDPDCKDYNPVTKIKTDFMVIYCLIQNEDTQVNGLEIMNDLTGLTSKHSTYHSMDTIKKIISIWQGAFPARFKHLHMYNMGPVLEAVWAIVRPFLSKKMQDRVVMHGNMENVYKRIPMRMLPDEYLPDDYKGPRAGSCKQLADEFVKTLSSPEVRKTILEETKAEYGIDLSKRPTDVPQTSFRRLAVD